METNNEKWLAGQLERHADGQDVELPTGLAHISDSLQQTMREIQPRSGFVDELAGRLQAQRTQPGTPPPPGKNAAARLWRLLAGVAGVAALAAFAWFVAGLFSSPPLAADVTSAPPEQPTTLSGATPSPTPLPAGLSLTAPGWIHTVEQIDDGSMATVDEESGEIVNLQTPFQIDAWSLLDEQGRVVSYIHQVRDLDGNLLQATTLRDGVSRNLTLRQELPVSGPPGPFPWADPHSPLYHDAGIELLLIERAPAPPAEALALLQLEIASNACAGLTLVDEAAWDAREQYNRWLDALAAEIGGQPDRWLHLQLARQQNPDAVIHADSPLPHDYQSEQWIRLDEAGRVVARVGIVTDGEGRPFSTGVRRDGVAYDFTQQQNHPNTPQRLDLASNFFANIGSAAGGLALLEEQIDGRPALRYSVCRSYNGARPRFGALPDPIEGDQWHLWLDAESGQPLRSGSSYADVNGRVHTDWTEAFTVEVVNGLPPQAQALWLQAEQTEQGALPPTPTPPAVPFTYPGITLTLQSASYEATQTTISLTLQIATDDVARAHGASQGRLALFDDAGNEYQPTLGNAGNSNSPPGLVAEISQSFEPALAPEAQRLTLQASLSLSWAADRPIILDLRERQVGDRWPVNETVEIYGLQLPIEEAALVADPDAPPGSLAIQLFAPCVAAGGVVLTFLDITVEEGQHMGSGPGHSACDRGEQQLVASTTVKALLDGDPPAALESATLYLVGRLELTGPWELSWDVVK